MTRSLTFVRRSALMTLMAATLVACSGGDGGTGDDTGTESDDGLSPLEEYLGEGMVPAGGNGMVMRAFRAPEQTEEQRQAERDIQDQIATCMSDLGFEYVPYVPDEGGASVFDEAFALPPEEFAREYGYGISTLMGLGDDTSDDDPNTAIAEALSEDARQAYNEALWGEGTMVNGGGGVTITRSEGDDGPRDAGEPGCWQKAAEEIHGAPPAPGEGGFEDFDALFDDLQSLADRIDTDPRLTEGKLAWADCMADAGFADYVDPAEAQQDVEQRFQDLMGMPTDEDEGPTDAGPDADDGDGDGGVEAIAPDDIDPEALAEVKEFELDVAPDDYTCRQEHYEDLYEQVRDELEQEFVDDNEADLEAFREWSSSNVPGGMRVG